MDSTLCVELVCAAVAPVIILEKVVDKTKITVTETNVASCWCYRSKNGRVTSTMTTVIHIFRPCTRYTLSMESIYPAVNGIEVSVLGAWSTLTSNAIARTKKIVNRELPVAAIVHARTMGPNIATLPVSRISYTGVFYLTTPPVVHVTVKVRVNVRNR